MSFERFPWRRMLVLVTGAVTALAASSTWAGPALERIRQSGEITIAHRESSVPFSYYDADKKPVGYAIDLCLQLAEAVRKNLQLKTITPKYVMVTSADRLTVVAEGRADFECGSTTNNAERREKVAFTVPHYIAGARIMVRADSRLGALGDFGGKKLVSTKGATPLAVVKKLNDERMLRIQILEAPDHARAVEMVEKGEADGFVMDDVLLYGLIAGRPDPTKLKVVGKFLTTEALAIMMPKNDPELKKIADEEMKRLINSKEAHAIYKRWFLEPIPPKKVSLNLPMNYLHKDFWKYPNDKVPN